MFATENNSKLVDEFGVEKVNLVFSNSYNEISQLLSPDKIKEAFGEYNPYHEYVNLDGYENLISYDEASYNNLLKEYTLI